MGACAAVGPWLIFGCRGGAGPDPVEWVAKMTGQRTRSGSSGTGSWGMFAGPPFAPPWAGAGRGWRGPKARRGDVRAAILGVLAERSMNGYQIIQEIAARTDGAWKPSPGSIYPTLQQLEDEGLVVAKSDAGRRAYALTAEGRIYVAEHADEVAAPWQSLGDPGDGDGLKLLVGQVASAVWQLISTGTAAQQAKGRDAMLEFRRRLQAILDEDSGEGEPS